MLRVSNGFSVLAMSVDYLSNLPVELLGMIMGFFDDTRCICFGKASSHVYHAIHGSEDIVYSNAVRNWISPTILPNALVAVQAMPLRYLDGRDCRPYYSNRLLEYIQDNKKNFKDVRSSPPFVGGFCHLHSSLKHFISEVAEHFLCMASKNAERKKLIETYCRRATAV
jgi:hypothetical protein